MKKYKAIAVPVSLSMGNRGFLRWEIGDLKIGFSSQVGVDEERFTIL